MKDILKWLERHEACFQGMRYSRKCDNATDWWNGMRNGDWMSWVVRELDLNILRYRAAMRNICKPLNINSQRAGHYRASLIDHTERDAIYWVAYSEDWKIMLKHFPAEKVIAAIKKEMGK